MKGPSIFLHIVVGPHLGLCGPLNERVQAWKRDNKETEGGIIAGLGISCRLGLCQGSYYDGKCCRAEKLKFRFPLLLNLLFSGRFACLVLARSTSNG